MSYAWLHVRTLTAQQQCEWLVNKASFHRARLHNLPLPRSVCRRSALKPRRPAADGETRQKTHVNALGLLRDSDTDCSCLLHKMDKKPRVVARRATHAQFNAASRCMMSTRKCWKLGSRAPLLGDTGELQYCLFDCNRYRATFLGTVMQGSV